MKEFATMRLLYISNRLREELSHKGILETLRKVCRTLLDRVKPPWQCLFWMPVEDFEPAVADAQCALKVIAKLDDDPVLADLNRNFGEATMNIVEERITRGCQFYVLLRGQAIAGTLFIVFGKNQFFQHVVLTERDAAVLDARINPQFRGQGLYSIFLNLSLGSLKRLDIQRVFVATSEHNVPSLRALHRVGFKYLFRYKIRMGTYKFDVKPL